MRARGVRLKGVQGQSDLALDFRGEDGRCRDVVILYGSSTSAKRMILRGFFDSYGRSVTRKEASSQCGLCLPTGLMWLEFDLGAEITTVKIQDGVIHHSNAIFRASSFSLAAGAQYADNCCLFYDSRVARVSEVAGNPPVGIIWPLIYEAHRRQIKDSIIMVDDFDALLSETEAQDVFRHLLPLVKARGNQLVISTSHRYLRGLVPEGSWYELQEGADPLLKGVLRDIQRAR